MLDVFCCALGCVTLLWLLNTREAERARRSGPRPPSTDLAEHADNLLATQADIETTHAARSTPRSTTRRQSSSPLTTERDETAKQLAAAKADLADRSTRSSPRPTRRQRARRPLPASRRTPTTSTAKLARRRNRADELRQAAAAEGTGARRPAREDEAADEQLNDARREAASAVTRSDDAKDAPRRHEEDPATNSPHARTRSATCRRSSTTPNANIIDLQGDKKKLADKFDKLRIEQRSRFAGIAMTGKRVVFVVDISGSMKLIDEKTPAPTSGRPSSRRSPR